MNFKKMALVVLCIAAFASLSISFAYAGSATSVSNFRVGVTPTDMSGQAPLNTQVYVYWDSITPSGGTVDITIYNPSGVLIASYPNVAPSASGTIHFTVDTPGSYYVQADGFPSYHAATTFVAGASVLVLPESVLGTLAAVGAGVAAFGTVKLYQKRKKD